MSKFTPECPFCGRTIERPRNAMTEFGEIISGRCQCGAAYVCDPTGHNVGEAYGDAMAFAAGDWNIGELEADCYALEEMDYDLKSHSRVSAKGMNFQAGKLICIKMKSADDKVARSQLETAQPEMVDSGTAAILEDPAFSGMRLKDKVRHLLERGLLEAIGKLALKDKTVIKWLISHSYDKDDLMTWRAIEAMGYVALDLKSSHMGILRETVRKMLWSMSDESGGIGWSAPEILGEITRSSPEEFSDLIPILWSNREEPSFKAGAICALWRVACVRPDMVILDFADLQELASDPDPAVRAYTALLARAIPLERKAEVLEKLSGDSSTFRLYSGRVLREVAVSEAAALECDL